MKEPNKPSLLMKMWDAGPWLQEGFGSLVLARNYRGEMELDNILCMCLLLLYKGALKTKDVWDIVFS